MRAMNQLKVHIQQAIMALHKQGWSGRKIARELDLDRATVGKYLRQESKPAIVPAGSDPPEGSKPAIVLTGSGEQTSSPAETPSGGKSPGRTSQCQPLREQIQAMVQSGLSAQRFIRTW